MGILWELGRRDYLCGLRWVGSEMCACATKHTVKSRVLKGSVPNSGVIVEANRYVVQFANA